MFEVTTTVHDMPGIQIKNPTADQRWFLKRAVTCNHACDPAYRLGYLAQPFLQCDTPDFVMVEFWGRHIGAFVAWLNLNFEREVAKSRGFGLLIE